MDTYTWTYQCWLTNKNLHTSPLYRHLMQSKDLPAAMDDRDRWREKESWWWWLCVCVCVCLHHQFSLSLSLSQLKILRDSDLDLLCKTNKHLTILYWNYTQMIVCMYCVLLIFSKIEQWRIFALNSVSN